MFAGQAIAGDLRRAGGVAGAADRVAARHRHAAEAARRSRCAQRAFEAAPTSAGTIDGQPFEWIADADMRLGPVCEAVINGRYYWVPFERLTKIDLEAPADLRDVVWMPAHFQFSNGGEAVGLIPTRYPGSESADDAQVRLARKTVWNERRPTSSPGSDSGSFRPTPASIA